MEAKKIPEYFYRVISNQSEGGRRLSTFHTEPIVVKTIPACLLPPTPVARLAGPADPRHPAACPPVGRGSPGAGGRSNTGADHRRRRSDPPTGRRVRESASQNHSGSDGREPWRQDRVGSGRRRTSIRVQGPWWPGASSAVRRRTAPAGEGPRAAHRWVPKRCRPGLVLIRRTYGPRSKRPGPGQRRWLMHPAESLQEA